jgi:hypothetical protein
MSIEKLDTETADRNLTSAITVLTDTPDASNNRLCKAIVYLGAGAKLLDGTGGDFELTITVNGYTWDGGPDITTFAAGMEAAVLQSNEFFVEANDAVTVLVKSPNPADTDVTVTADLVSESLSLTSAQIQSAADAAITANAQVLDLVTGQPAQKYAGPYGPGVYVATGYGAAGTVFGVNGTVDSPSDNLANAITLATSLGQNRIYLKGDSTLSLAGQTLYNYEFIGLDGSGSSTINLGTAGSPGDLTSTKIEGCTVYGTHVTATDRVTLVDCKINDAPAAELTTIHIHAFGCLVVGDITLDTSDDNVLMGCADGVPGTTSPIINASGAAGTVLIEDWSGGLELASLSATHNVRLDGNGRVTFAASCSVNADIAIYGAWTEVDNTAGMVNIERAASYNRSNVDAAITASAIIGLTYDFTEAINDTANAILLDTGTTIPATIADLPTVAEFNARSLPSADYFVVGDYTASSPSAIADAVWDELQSAHVTAGSFGEIATEIDAILLDTGTTLPATLTADKAEVIAAVDAMSGVVVSGAEINIADTSKRQIEWDSASETITGTVQWDGQTAKAITGAITFRETLGGNHYYDWAYDAADRPTVASAGVVVLTDGVDTSTLAVSFIDVASETTATGINELLLYGIQAPWTITQGAAQIVSVSVSDVFLQQTEAGKVYARIADSGGNAVVTLYSDAARSESIAAGTGSGLGSQTIALAATNSSGVTGSVNCDYTADEDFVVEGKLAMGVEIGISDVALVTDGGIKKISMNRVGRSELLTPLKTVKQANGLDLTDPDTQRYGGYEQE